MATAQTLWQLLQEAVEHLDKAASEIRDLPLEPRNEHIHRIGEALSNVFEIQYHLFALQPELTPSVMKGPFENPQGAWEVAVRHATSAEEKGHISMAIAIFEWIASQLTSSEYERRARQEIGRLKGEGDA